MSDLLQFRVSVATNEMYQLHLSHSTDSLAHTTEFVLRHDADGHDVHLIQIVSRHLSISRTIDLCFSLWTKLRHKPTSPMVPPVMMQLIPWSARALICCGCIVRFVPSPSNHSIVHHGSSSPRPRCSSSTLARFATTRSTWSPWRPCQSDR